jgi:periplasmic copper chaperone A
MSFPNVRTTPARPVRLVAVLSALAVLPSCSGASTADSTTARPAASASSGTGPTSPATAPGQPVVLQDPWVKTASSGMTAVFGSLRNTGSADVKVTSASTDASPRTELHETVTAGGSMKMRPKAGGFVVPAGGVRRLEPGGDHIMVMGLTRPVRPGDVVRVTLRLSDGSTYRVTALGKDTSGGEETYDPTKP